MSRCRECRSTALACRPQLLLSVRIKHAGTECQNIPELKVLCQMPFAKEFATSQVVVSGRCFESQKIWQGILLVCRLDLELVKISLNTGNKQVRQSLSIVQV